MEKEDKQKILNQILRNVKNDFNKVHEFIYDSSEVPHFYFFETVKELMRLGYIDSYDGKITIAANIGIQNIVFIKVNKLFKNFCDAGGFIRD